MANKKVFTNLTFEGGAELLNPRLEPTSSAPTSKGPGQAYFNTGGTLNLQFADIDCANDWRAVHTSGVAFSTSVLFTSTMVDGNPPLAVTSKTVIPNLTVEALGTPVTAASSGFHVRSTTATEHGIPIYGTNGVLKVGTPVADDDAAPKVYVDSAVQGLDHKESVKYTTTAHLTSVDGIITTGLADSGIDTTTNPVVGDRILAKNQNKPGENGIWIVTTSSWTRATDADVTGTQLIEGGSFSSTSDITDGTPNNWQSVNSAVLTSAGSGVSGNCLRVQTVSGQDGAAYQDITTVVGKSYRISLYMNKGTSGTVAYLVGIASDTDSILGASDTDSTASGWVLHESVFKATATTTRITLISRDSASTDYSEFDSVSVKETALSEGAFVFVEDGTTLPNTSWVLSNGVTHAWTQFSGAGQLTVQSNGAVVDATTGGPLVKSGDNINFKFGTSYFDINSTDGTLEIGAGAVGTDQLANDAVEPAKLLETGAFTMGELTSSKLYATTWLKLQDGSTASGLIGASNKVGAPTTPASDLAIRSYGAMRFITQGDWGNPLVTMTGGVISSRKVGIGADATTPSGTLHVSTARYGDEMFTNGGAEAFSGGQATGWINGTGTESQSTSIKHSGASSQKIVADDTSDLAEGILWNDTTLVKGQTYKYSAWAYSATGTRAITLRVRDSNNGYELQDTKNVGAAWTEFAGTFTANANSTATAPGTGGADVYFIVPNGVVQTSDEYYFDDFSLKEDNLGDGVSTLGDDLVVGGKSGTGISIISKANTSSNLYFGDGIQKDFIRITGSRSIVTGDSNGDSTLYFQASDGGAAPASVMTLFGADKSVKIEGGLGVGGVVADSAGTLTVQQPASSQSAGAAIKAIGTAYGTNKAIHAYMSTANATRSLFYAENSGGEVMNVAGDGNVYFPSGNVAIGGTTADELLQVSNTGTYDDARIAITSGNLGDSELLLGDVSDRAHGKISYWNRADADTSALKSAMSFTTHGVENLRLKKDGELDQRGNSIVNSSTVQGLQDGAAYTFDGTDGKISVDAVAAVLVGSTTGAIRWRGKFNSGGLDSGDRIWTVADTSANEFIMFRTDSANKLVGWCRNAGTDEWKFTTSSTFTNGVVYDFVLVQNGTTPVLYADGVEVGLDFEASYTDKTAWFDECTGVDNLRIGSSQYNGAAESSFLACTVLQFQIFPSALTAGDVRKLYSGENPKKNLTVGDLASGVGSAWTGATGATPPTGWVVPTGGAPGTYTIDESSGSGAEPGLKLQHDGTNHNPMISVGTAVNGSDGGFKTVVGKYYRLSFRAKHGTTSSQTRAGLSTTWGGENIKYFTFTNTSWADYSHTFQATETTAHLYFTIATATSGQYSHFDSVTFYEVDTLVDFNSRSASTTKWYNAAIPALYNGTLQGGVTLSAGSTDYEVGAGEDRAFRLGDLALYRNSDTAGRLQLGHYANRLSDTSYALQIHDTGEVRINAKTGQHIFFNQGDNAVARIEADGDFFIASGKKLGVGTSPGYLIHGKDATADMRLQSTTTTNRSGYQANNGGGTSFFYRDGNDGNETVSTLTALPYSTVIAGTGDYPMQFGTNSLTRMVILGDGSVGIGSGSVTGSAGGRLFFKSPASANGEQPGRIEWWNENGAGIMAKISCVREASANAPGALGFYTSADVDTSSNTSEGSWSEKMRISSAGDIGISTTTPQGRLDVKGSIRGEAKKGETVLLIHSDTTDEASAVVDSSFYAYTVTKGGNVHHEVDQKKFGASSIQFDGNGDYLSIPFSSYWNFSNNDFTLETWIRPTSMTDHAGNAGTILSQDDNSSNKGWDLRLNSNGTLLFRHSTTGGNEVDTTSSATGIAINNWYHVAFVRSSDAYAFYVNGVQKGTGSLTNTIYNSTYAVLVGARGPSSGGGNLFFTGYLDEVRISRVARWISSFTPPSSPYSTVNAEFFNEYDKQSTLGFGTPLLREGALDGAAYYFDGSTTTDPTITIASPSFPTGASPRTIAGWVNMEDVTRDTPIFGYGDAGTTSGADTFEFYHYQSSSKSVGIRIHNAVSNSGGTTPIIPNVWMHIAATYDGTTVKVYYDGVFNHSQTITLATTSAVARLGADSYAATPGVFFKGSIRSVQVFPSALNSGEVAQLYNGYNPKKNLNVNFLSDALSQFTTSSGWSISQDWSRNTSTNKAEITSWTESSFLQRAESPGVIVSGKQYLVTADIVRTSASGTLSARVGNSSYYSIANEIGASVVVTAGSTATETVLFYSSAWEGTLDNVKVSEVTTLVDFNSRSASPATWHNSAIPALYNGTVNGASMSAGSTDHYVAGDFRADGALTASGLLTASDSLDVVGSALNAQTITTTTCKTLGIKLSTLGGSNTGNDIIGGFAMGNNNEEYAGMYAVDGGSAANTHLCLFSGSNTNGIKESLRIDGLSGTAYFRLATACEGTLNVTGSARFDGNVIVDTATGSKPLWITRLGATNEAMSIKVEDRMAEFELNQDETTGDCLFKFNINSSTTGNKYYQFHNGRVGINRIPNTDYDLDVVGLGNFDKGVRTGADSDTVLLIHSDTTDGATTFVDSSPSGRALTVAGSPTHSTTQKKFGATSLLFNGSDQHIEIAGSTDFDFGTDPFTIDFWERTSSVTSGTRMHTCNFTSLGSTNNINFDFNDSSVAGLWVYWNSGGSNKILAGSDGDYTDAEWHHIALTRSGNTIRLFIDGVLIGSETETGSMGHSSKSSYVGSAGGSQWWPGFIDEVRVSKGVARWTSDFTPPNRPYSTVNDEFFNDLSSISKTGINLGDNSKIRLGTGGDFEIFHNGTDAVLQNFVSGKTIVKAKSDFFVQTNSSSGAATDTLTCSSTGNVQTHYKLGVGRIAGDESLEVQGNIKLIGGTNHRFKIANDHGNNWAEIGNDGASTQNTLEFFTGSSATPSMSIVNGGNVGIGCSPNQYARLHTLVSGGHNEFRMQTHRADQGQNLFAAFFSRGSSATPGIVVDGDTVLEIQPKGYDGANYHRIAEIDFRVDGTPDTNDMPGRMVFSTNPAGVGDSPVERLRISSDGTQNHSANRIVNSQTVSDLNRTAEPSLYFDGTNDYVNTNSVTQIDGAATGTISAWVKLRTLTGTPRRGLQHHILGKSGAVDKGFGFADDDSGKLALKLTSHTVWTNTPFLSTNAVTAGKWHHVVGTWDSSGMALYIDGVLDNSNAVAGTWEASATYPNLIGRQYAASAAGAFDGEMRDVRIHNRALEDTEVAAAYNGESTPWRHSDATFLYEADWSANVDNWDSVNAGGFYVTGHDSKQCLKYYANATDGTHYFSNSTGNAVTTALRAYKVSFKYWLPASQTHIDGLWLVEHNSGQVKNLDGTTYTTIHSTTGAWTSVSVECYHSTLSSGFGIRALDGGSGSFPGANSSSDDSIYIADWKIEALGEVAAYTPQSINDKWYDTTSNANHGTISSGATRLNELKHYGQLDVEGTSSDLILNKDGSGEAGIRFHKDGAAFSYIKLDGNEEMIYHAPLNEGHHFYANNDSAFRITSGNEVQARSSGSGTLKQVARVHSETVVVNTGTALAYTVTHNLGTKGIIASAQDSNNDFVDVHVNAATNDTAVFTFAGATAVASNEDFIFTIMGGGAPEAA